LNQAAEMAGRNSQGDEMITIGQKIAELRKQRGWTQEELATRLNVSAQAVSKWETDQSLPDVSLLVGLAGLLGVSVDGLLKPEQELVRPEPEGAATAVRIVVTETSGETVTVKVPLKLVRFAASVGMALPQTKNFEGVDLRELLRLIEHGAAGKVMEVSTSSGDNVEFYLD
jgi:transcriptional regulator with XRE-family HTH domain